MRNEISNLDDVIDSRDIINRLDDLRDADGLSDEEKIELATLANLDEEGRDYSEDWEYGATLIRDSYWKTYAEEYAYDVGALNKDYSWPHDCIDWDKAARDLRVDYTPIDFGGVTYWVR